MSKERLNPEESALEAGLASLIPAQVAWDRDDLLYRAGFLEAKRQTRSTQRWWMTSTMGLLLVCLWLGLSSWRDKQDQDLEVVEAPRQIEQQDRPEMARGTDPVATAVPTQVAAHQYLRLRQQALHHGIDALPEWEAESNPGNNLPTSTSRELFHELLGS